MKKMSYDIIVVGAGGTGTYFLKEFSRYLTGVDKNLIHSLSIIDGDTVEEKNLERQAFASFDIGQNKAAVMADALNSAFNLNWQAYAAYLTDMEQLRAIIGPNLSETRIPVIVGCVDNHACRLLLEEYFYNKDVDRVFLLDSANEYSTGEVVFAYKLKGKVISPPRTWYFPAIKNGDTRKRTEMSCEELNKVAPQHIATNMAAGNILLRELCTILDGRLDPGMVTFDVATFVQEYMSYSDLVKEDVA